MSAAKLKLHAPVLLTRDLPKSIKYWNDQVGFESRNVVGDPPHFAILGRNDCFLMLKQAPQRPHHRAALESQRRRVERLFLGGRRARDV